MSSTNLAPELAFRSVGEDVQIWPQAKIVSPERISVGNSVLVDDFVLLMAGEETVIGDFVHLAAFSSLVGGGRIVLEDFAGISGGVRLYSGNERYDGTCLTNPTVPAPFREPVRSFVKLEKHAIVGANSVVLPGVTVGEGAVIGANSLVGRDCKPWTVYMGSPARAVAKRPKERMLELEAELRSRLYDADGRYVPKAKRETA